MIETMKERIPPPQCRGGNDGLPKAVPREARLRPDPGSPDASERSSVEALLFNIRSGSSSRDGGGSVGSRSSGYDPSEGGGVYDDCGSASGVPTSKESAPRNVLGSPSLYAADDGGDKEDEGDNGDGAELVMRREQPGADPGSQEGSGSGDEDSEDDDEDEENASVESSEASEDDDDDDDEDDVAKSEDDDSDGNAFAEGPDGRLLSKYEQMRLHKIKRNTQRLEQLGLGLSGISLKKKVDWSRRKKPQNTMVDGSARIGEGATERRRLPSRGARTAVTKEQLTVDLDLRRRMFRTATTPTPTKVRSSVSVSSTQQLGGTPFSGLRRGRCGVCPGCVRDDCGTCVYCLDKPKFGGANVKRQRCALRGCDVGLAFYSPDPRDALGREGSEGMEEAKEDGDDNNADICASHVEGAKEDGDDKNADICASCGDGGDLLCCDGCDGAYHLACHVPKVYKLPEGQWFCMRCHESGKAATPQCKRFATPRMPKVKKRYIFADISGRKVRCSVVPQPAANCSVCSVEGEDVATCKSCYKSYHLQCHNPPLEGYPRGRFKCGECKQVGNPFCSVCSQPADPKEVATCKYCSTPYHLKCHLPALESKPHGPWRCEECKQAQLVMNPNCTVCSQPADPKEAITCKTCIRPYHLNCHLPALESKPRGRWSCEECKQARTLQGPTTQRRVAKPKALPQINHKNDDDCFLCYNGGELVCCDYCVKSFHAACHIPALAEVPRGRWKCMECSAVERKKKSRCGACDACKHPDCGECIFCKDKTKFGGINSLKKPCLKRVCLYQNLAAMVPAGFGSPETPTGSCKKKKKISESVMNNRMTVSPKNLKLKCPSKAKTSAQVNTEQATLLQSKFRDGTGQSELKEKYSETKHPNRASQETVTDKSKSESTSLEIELSTIHRATLVSSGKLLEQRSPTLTDQPVLTTHKVPGEMRQPEQVPLFPNETREVERNIPMCLQSQFESLQDLHKNQSRQPKQDSESPNELDSSEHASSKKRGRKRQFQPEPEPSRGQPKVQQVQRKCPRLESLTDPVKSESREGTDETKGDIECSHEWIEKICGGTDLVSTKIAKIISIALAKPDVPKCQDKAIENLRKITTTTAIATKIINLGGVKLIMKAMRSHPQKNIVQAEACGALAELIWINPSNGAKISKEGGLALIVESMERLGMNTKVQQMGCGAFRALTYEDANIKHIEDVGGTCAVIAAMARNPLKAHVQKEGCFFLQNMTFISPVVSHEIVQAGIIPTIMHSMFSNPDYIDLQESACGVLSNLALDERTRTAACKAGAIPNVLSALEKCQDLAVKQVACTALQRLISGSPENQEVATKAGGVQLTLIVMEAYPTDSQFLTAVCGVLKELASYGSNAGIIAQAGGIKLILLAMDNHAELPLLQEAACSALRCFYRVQKYLTADMGEKIIEVMQNHKNEEYVQVEACRTLVKFARIPSVAQLLNEGRTRKVLSTIQKKHSEKCGAIVNYLMDAQPP